MLLLLGMKFACLFVCLVLASATNALPADFFKDGGYVNLAAAQASAEEIAKAGAGLDVLEGLLEEFNTAATDHTIEYAEYYVETVATPYDYDEKPDCVGGAC